MNARANQPASSPADAPAARRPRMIVLGYGQPEIVQAEFVRLRPLIEHHAEIVLTDLGEYKDLAQVEAEFAIVLGGDGAILRAAKQMAYRQLPVLGVNLGRLGFLADLTPDEFVDVLPVVAAGKVRL
ncbi:MAG TPA: NAD(+)/NADH kinase, partial [Pirellulales bacterium]|nr:NAD(+)/NADH kinase [Pirellulales bacterium]